MFTFCVIFMLKKELTKKEKEKILKYLVDKMIADIVRKLNSLKSS